jgi:steroid delta-isomerase-like uncharacterized protein
MRYFEEVCNGRKLNVADSIFTADHVHHDPSSPWVGAGPEGMKKLASTYQTGFPDAHWNVDALFESGDTVIARWTGTGTHQGELSGIAPTGKSVRVEAIMIFRIADGKIAESWDVWDTLGMLQQLGVVPRMEAGAVQ